MFDFVAECAEGTVKSIERKLNENRSVQCGMMDLFKDFLYDGEKHHITIKEGQNVYIPTHGLHHDPKYYPNPERFDPSRFSEENKHLLVPGTYLPFGSGPRVCIGSRFALM